MRLRGVGALLGVLVLPACGSADGSPPEPPPPALTCATLATPDLTVTTVSNGLEFWSSTETGQGVAYGHAECPGYYVAEVAESVPREALYVSVHWDSLYTPRDCTRMHGEMHVFTQESGEWRVEKSIGFEGKLRGTRCNIEASDPALDIDTTWYPVTAAGKVRVALKAMEGEQAVPVLFGVREESN